MRILFVHPDLGVGGAERLIVDAAMAAKSHGHSVTVLTNHYDPAHCFEDTRTLEIIAMLSWMPRCLMGRFHALLAYLKLVLASLWLIYASNLKFDVVVCDQISLPVVFFKWAGFKCLFYCHFPDQLLCVYDKRRNLLKRIYRAPLDWLEMTSTGMADVVLVNSRFTSRIFYDTFKILSEKQIDVLYPSLNTDVFDAVLNDYDSNGSNDDKNGEDKSEFAKSNQLELDKSATKKFLFLSINRYERKKDLKLAIEALAVLKRKLSPSNWQACHLIMAGGYDKRVSENVEHYEELQKLANGLGVSDHVSFMRSVSDRLKIRLLRRMFCLVYTPTNEHFGIVPIEAMYCEKPVIATNTGGPLETVADGQTGYLVEAKADQFADAMAKLVAEPSKQTSLGAQARRQVIENFSFLAFQKKLVDVLAKIEKLPRPFRVDSFVFGLLAIVITSALILISKFLV